MLPGHKILLRYKTLDKCFRSTKKRTLEMLIEHCSSVLDEKISKRSIQSDIQFLRDNGAPIIVKEKKYYTYEDKSYSLLKREIPKKLEEQFLECIDFVKEISDFPKYNQYKDTLRTITPRKDKTKPIDYIKLYTQQMAATGFFTSKKFLSDAELRKLTKFVRSQNLEAKRSVANTEAIMEVLLNSKLKNLVKKINPRAFLVEAIYSNNQNPSDFEQILDLPMRQRKIPQNLTLWGYPVEEKVEKPDKNLLFKDTFVLQLFLKDVNEHTGALEVIAGSHQRELSPLEIKLITNNTFPTSCEVDKGGIVGYKPMLIQRVSKSESPKNKPSIILWFSSYHLPVHYMWNHEIQL